MIKRVVSIIISNYNYGRFVRQAIDSALCQTYSPLEVIVVDDGSTDKSREIISAYSEKIIPVFKKNGGQASAFNAGFSKCKGDVILFLDSDDILFSNAVENAITHFVNSNIAKVHWPLEIINENGVKTGARIRDADLPEGEFKYHALHSGPPFFLNPPTSGNAWSRAFIESIMPVPENEFILGADTYLFETVAFFGSVKKIDRPQGGYRIHSNNNYNNKSFDLKLKTELNYYDSLFIVLENYCKKLNLVGNPLIWKSQSWFHKINNGIQEIKKRVPDRSTIILVDEEKWGIVEKLESFKILPLMERNGKYAGLPVDSKEAISAILQLQKKGAAYIVFVWSSFWWLEYYEDLTKFLFQRFILILKNEDILVFELNHIL